MDQSDRVAGDLHAPICVESAENSLGRAKRSESGDPDFRRPAGRCLGSTGSTRPRGEVRCSRTIPRQRHFADRDALEPEGDLSGLPASWLLQHDGKRLVGKRSQNEHGADGKIQGQEPG